MQYFDSFSLTLLTTNELTSFAVSLDKATRTIPSIEGFLFRQLDPIALAVMKIDQLNGRIAGTEWTDKLLASDGDRDDLYGALVSDLKSNLRKAKAAPERVEPSEKLLVIIGANPVDIRSGYANENSQLRQLLAVLLLKENMKLAKLASVDTTILALAEEEKVFEELFTQKIDAETLKETGRVREQRAIVTERINNILVWLGSNAVDLPDEFGAVADQVNTLIKNIMAPARSRASKKAIEEAAEAASALTI